MLRASLFDIAYVDSCYLTVFCYKVTFAFQGLDFRHIEIILRFPKIDLNLS